MASVSALMVGATFAGDYTIEAPLSSGGMGAVYVAVQQSTGKRRALKVMHPQLVSNPDLRARFEREAQIGSRIDSENIVEVTAAGVDPETGTPYIIMELLRGSDLARHMMTGPMSLPKAREIMEQLCSGVAAAHAAGVVHRDLKPENVFLAQSKLTQTGVIVKVLDFGIAKLAASAGSTASMGSPMWMAPEQTDRHAITAAADVWSLALILYFMLTGRYYWHSANDPEAGVPQLLREILMEPLVPASERAAQQGAGPLPPGFDVWFARCVNRDARQRFSNAHEAWLGLEPIFGPRGPQPSFGDANLTPSAPLAIAHTPQGTAPPISATKPALQTRPLGIALVGIAGLIGLGGVGYLAWSKLRPHANPENQTAILVANPTQTTEVPPASRQDAMAPSLPPASTEVVSAPPPVSASITSSAAPAPTPVVATKPAQPSQAAVMQTIAAATPAAQACVTKSLEVTVTFQSDGSVKSVDAPYYERPCLLRAFQTRAKLPPFTHPTYQITVPIDPP